MHRVDLVIAGAGYVGLSTALSVKLAAPHLEIVVVDPAPPPGECKSQDVRASAIALAAQKMLDQLGIWEVLKADAQPINEMIVTDSNTDDAVRPVYLTFDQTVENGKPFAHMVLNRELIRALENRAKTSGVDMRYHHKVVTFEEQNASNLITLQNGAQLQCSCLVAADGINSSLRALAGIKTIRADYGQSGIVTTIAHEKPHHGRAVEHFLPSGPFAILPLTENRSSLVWTEKTNHADRLVRGDSFVFEVELGRRLGHQLGSFEVIGSKRAYPIQLILAKSFISGRLALLGDAAHGIHPIAGQGLNLGFKDVAAFSEVLVEADRLGQDIGAFDVLERYQQWRRFDTWLMGVTTDTLNRLFSNQNNALRLSRTIGLGLVDRLPWVKELFMNKASGTLNSAQPRLLNGKPL